MNLFKYILRSGMMTDNKTDSIGLNRNVIVFSKTAKFVVLTVSLYSFDSAVLKADDDVVEDITLACFRASFQRA